VYPLETVLYQISHLCHHWNLYCCCKANLLEAVEIVMVTKSHHFSRCYKQKFAVIAINYQFHLNLINIVKQLSDWLMYVYCKERY
jgi:hypothetical protein